VIDSALIVAAASGDSDAMEQLVREQAPPVFAYLVGMLGDEPEAETALQETFVRIARAVGRYDPGIDAEAWVFGIARRVTGDIRPTPAAPAGEPPPADGDTAEWVKRSLRSLPSDLREVVVLTELLKWPVERAAVVMDIEPGQLPELLRAAHTQVAEGMQSAPTGAGPRLDA
jgi:DNA-directed RNA polymerase specialized sigma24 family protein